MAAHTGIGSSLEGDARAAGHEPSSAAGPKSIVLFSDGTGNSSAKLFKTNVWRMYEAVDLGPAAPGKRAQISYYDDGVGTSSFKPLAALGGAFGWGLKRNVLDIYRYACRNYREGDDLYAFGFSRGAFTARVVVALIASEGLVRSDTEAELERRTTAAYRSFREAFLPRRLQWPTKLARTLRRVAIDVRDRLGGRRPYDASENVRPDIRFVGVWDTVAAYGGPIKEITRAVDNWFFPLSMPDYRLHERVHCARHALALDDERDAFHPLLWDEVHERSLIESGVVEAGRLQQVWFTGMHADVGGGYPDESLSYVSLLWMMEEAERAGLRTLRIIKERILALASSYGPIHDSRSGVGAYYRYQPRKISSWLDPVDMRTLSLRDPAIVDRRGRSRGLLRSVAVHESVINRIATGTDRYAPITLPETFTVVPPQEHGENVPQADSETPAVPESAASAPLLDRRVIGSLSDEASAAVRERATERIWNFVWWRRLVYFATLSATLLLLALPLLLDVLGEPPVLADGRTWIGGVIRLLTVVLPAFAGAWVEVYADNPFYFLLFLVIVLVLLMIGRGIERRLRDEARGVWREALAGRQAAEETPAPRQLSLVQRFRNSHRYQRFFHVLKWRVLPDLVITPLAVVVLVWVVLGAYVQISLPFLENGTRVCRPAPAGATPITRVSRPFFPRDVCSDSFGVVAADERYVVTLDVIDPWYDASVSTSPEGVTAGELPAGLGYIAMPLKRVIGARYLQPLVEIRPHGERGRFAGNIQIYPLAMRQVGDSRRRFRAEFRAPRGGELFVFVNDAMLPFVGGLSKTFDDDYFYTASGSGPASERGNRGSACVTIESASTTQSETVVSMPVGCAPLATVALE